MKIGIALVPEEKFIDQFISLQERIHSFLDLSPKLGADRNLPHLTLVQGDFSKRIDYRELLATMHDVVKAKHSQVTVSPQKFVYVETGWYFLTVEKTPQLVALHNRAFELSKEYLVSPDVDGQDLRHHSPLERENYLKYGYRYIGEAFFPHFTLGRCLDDGDQAEANISKLNRLFSETDISQQIRIGRMTIYLMGEHGAHQETLHFVGLENL